MKLPPAPARIVGADGMPQLGRFAGATTAFDWHGLAAPYARSALWRRFHHKKWHYVSLVSDQVMAAVAIVDLGWTSTCFAYAFDRNDSDMMANISQDGLPGLVSVRNLLRHFGRISLRKRLCGGSLLGRGAPSRRWREPRPRGG